MATRPDREESAAYSNTPRCLVCGQPLVVRIAHGRKSGKSFVMLLCPLDGRHFRAFINDEQYVAGVLARLEGQSAAGEDVVDHDDPPVHRSGDNLERGSRP